MKVSILTASLVASLFLFSCQSTKEVATNQAEEELPVAQEEASTQEEEELTPAQSYQKRTEGITLSVVSSPKETAAGRAFSSPYVVHAEKDESAVANLGVSAYLLATEYPLTTDENGNAEFLPAVPVHSTLNSVEFFPSPIESEGTIKRDLDLMIACLDKSVRAEYRVHTSSLSKGGIILLLDMKGEKSFDENLPTSSELQKNLRQLGFTGIGNGPDFSAEILTGSDTAVLDAARRFLGRNYTGFLVYGKLSDKTQKEGDRAKSSLHAKVNCVDMKTGKTVCSLEFIAEGSGKNEREALLDARKKVSAEIASQIYYNL